MTSAKRLLKVLTESGFEANPKCQNPVCRAMAAVEKDLKPHATVRPRPSRKNR